MENLKQYILSLPPEFILGGIISSIIMFFTFLHFIKKELKEQEKFIVNNLLTSIESTSNYAIDIQNTIKADTFLYREYLNNTLNFLDRHLGNLKRFHVTTWEKHFTYSLIYSFFFFYAIWFFGGDGKIGTYQFIPDSNRFLLTLFFILEITFYYYLQKKVFPITMTYSNKVFILISIISITVIFILGITIGRIIIIGTLVGVMILLLKEGILLIRIARFHFLLLVSVGILGITLNVFSDYMSYFLFLFILPLINSIFDYVSTYISRFFAYKILNTHSKGKVLIDIFLDLIIAIILFIGLAFTLFYTLEYFNGFIENKELLIPLNRYKDLLFYNPFNKEVLWITLMFLSTLIPTLIHFVLGLYSILALHTIKPHLSKTINHMNQLQDNDPNTYKKYQIAKQLAIYELSTTHTIKLYIIIGITIIIGFLISILTLFIKMGFTIF